MASITCLIGNGLSIAYNPELSVGNLTRYFLDEFSSLSGSTAARSLAMFASELTDSDQSRTFEELLGPLDSVSRAIPYLGGIGPLLGGGSLELRKCVNKVSQYALEVHRLGLGVVLQRIATCSQGQSGRLEETILTVLKRLVNAPRLGGDTLTIATLNYDGLLPAGLIRLRGEEELRFSDLGDGRQEAQASLEVSDSNHLHAQRIREHDDLCGNTHLLHLHGSLGWLFNPYDDTTWKFRIPELRNKSYWTGFREGRIRMFPRLVLTDQKAKTITERPFSLAYEVFKSRLRESDFWFISGYGFGDQPVNTVLRHACKKARDEGRPPEILITDPDSNTRNKALEVFPAIDEWQDAFKYCDAKLPEAVDTTYFNEFFGYSEILF